MDLSIPPPSCFDAVAAPPNTPYANTPSATTPSSGDPSSSAEFRVDSKEEFKFPVEEIIKGLDQVIADGDAADASKAPTSAASALPDRTPPTRILGDAKKIISSLYKRIDELEASVSMLQTWNKRLTADNAELRQREAKALKMLKAAEGERATLERQLSLQNREAAAVDEALEKTLKELADIH